MATTEASRIVVREGDVVLSVGTVKRSLYSPHAKFVVLHIVGNLVTLTRKWCYPHGAVQVVTWEQFVSDFRVLSIPARAVPV